MEYCSNECPVESTTAGATLPLTVSEVEWRDDGEGGEDIATPVTISQKGCCYLVYWCVIFSQYSSKPATTAPIANATPATAAAKAINSSPAESADKRRR